MIQISKLSMVIIGLLIHISFVQAGELKPLPGQTALRVCADPCNLPYSNDKFEGFDNKIASIIADELDIPVEYYWLPQRNGFRTNTVKKKEPQRRKFLGDGSKRITSERG